MKIKTMLRAVFSEHLLSVLFGPVTDLRSRDRAVNTRAGLGSIWLIQGLGTYVLNNKMAQITQKYFVLLTGHSPHYPEPPTLKHFRALMIL